MVKGIQVGTGLSLTISAETLYPHSTDHKATTPLILILAFLALLTSSTFRRIPYALFIVLVGTLFVLMTTHIPLPTFTL